MHPEEPHRNRFITIACLSLVCSRIDNTTERSPNSRFTSAKIRKELPVKTNTARFAAFGIQLRLRQGGSLDLHREVLSRVSSCGDQSAETGYGPARTSPYLVPIILLAAREVTL